MKRIMLAIIIALLGASNLFATTAKACISCEHVPVVVRGSLTSDSPTRYSKKRYKSGSTAKAKAIAAAKAKARAKAIAAAKAKAKVKAEALASAKAKNKKAAEGNKLLDAANSSVSTASLALERNEALDAEAIPVKKPKDFELGGCRKFFPKLGAVVPVPCE